MRIGIASARSRQPGTIENLIAQAKQAEATASRADGSRTSSHGRDRRRGGVRAGDHAHRARDRGRPTYPRHPVAMAQAALSAAAISRGRFSLGIGLSHQIVIEGMLGLSFAKPYSHMREYLAVSDRSCARGR